MDLGKVSQYFRRTASDLHADDFFLRMELFKWANFLSARVDGSTGGSLQPFTYYMYTSDSSQPSTVKRLKNIITAK